MPECSSLKYHHDFAVIVLDEKIIAWGMRKRLMPTSCFPHPQFHPLRQHQQWQQHPNPQVKRGQPLIKDGGMSLHPQYHPSLVRPRQEHRRAQMSRWQMRHPWFASEPCRPRAASSLPWAGHQLRSQMHPSLTRPASSIWRVNCHPNLYWWKTQQPQRTTRVGSWPRHLLLFSKVQLHPPRPLTRHLCHPQSCTPP